MEKKQYYINGGNLTMGYTLSVNAGSSSLKFKVFQMPEENVLGSGQVDRIGLNGSNISVKEVSGEKHVAETDIPDHVVAVQLMLDQLIEYGIIENYDQITGVGHRVVAGGEDFSESTIIDESVVEKIEELADFAPLHNPANATAIRAITEVLPDAFQVAVFDTSFHQTMPKKNYLYSLPMEYYNDFSARKYGAHGTSHQFLAQRVAEEMGQPIEDLKIITAHLGNGASITAIDGGKSVDTSMGFTPLAGLTMGTRSGDIDASLLPYLMDKLGLTDINDMIDILNNKSGLLGLSGVSSDMRDVEEAAAEGNEDAQIALDIFHDRVKKYIGQYIAEMNGVDAIVFSGGIGENGKETREEVINEISFFGVEIDKERNDVRGETALISTDDSKIKVYLIPTDEELAMARDVQRLAK